MEPDTNLYSQSENSEIIRENSQKILSVLAAHQIALWARGKVDMGGGGTIAK